MSSISPLKMFLQGPPAKFDVLNGVYAPCYLVIKDGQTPQQLEKRISSLEPRIVEVIHPDDSLEFSNYFVDNHIQVNATSDVFRRNNIIVWTEVKTTLKTVAWIGGMASLLSAAGAILAASNPFILTTCLVVAVTAVVFTAIALTRVTEASRQISLWGISPAETVATKRAMAYKQGFGYAYENQLKIEQDLSKTGSLDPNELLYLYRKYFPARCRELLQAPQHSKWILDFVHLNPLDCSLIHYAGESLTGNLFPIQHDFAELKRHLETIQQTFKKTREDVQEQANHNISECKQQRAVCLQPFKALKNYYIGRARQEHDKQLNSATTKKERDAIEKSFRDEKVRYGIFYDAAAAPLHAYFNDRIRKVENARDQTIRRLQQDESAQLSSLVPPGRTMLSQALRFWEEKATYINIDFSQYGFTVEMPPQPIPAPEFHPTAPEDWTPDQQQAFNEFIATQIPLS